MNWYKKLAQFFEDISDPEYGDPKSEDFKAHQYFSIGQNEETTNQSYCWIWTDGKLFAKKGPTTHNVAFRSLVPNMDNTYRGWYDPVQNLISVQFPSRSYIAGATYSEEDVPEIILQSLRRKFRNAEIKVF